MKRLFTITIILLLAITMQAQSPEKMSYQAVVRNANNELVKNQEVGMEISILQGTADGVAVYTETQTPTANANGLVSIKIGEGTTIDDFAGIDWVNGPYFIKTETDPAGGSNYTITGTRQLLSVPYALHAKTAETVTGTINETDPVFTDWDKSTGISITESQISDLQTYLTTETDPKFTDWDKDYTDLINTPTTITTAQANAITTNTTHSSATTGNPHSVTKTDVGLTNVDNTSDASKPVSTATQTALDAKANAENVLLLDNTAEFTPDADYEPATKKYVDDAKPAHYVGELFGGGIVFYVYNNGQNGLIASLNDLDGGSGVAWSATTGIDIGASAQSFYDGEANTAAIVSQDATAGYAATLCYNYAGGGYSDWYLPSSWELNILYNSAFLIGKILENDGDSSTNPACYTYWSSTETVGVSGAAWPYGFNGGYSNYLSKTTVLRVRAVRAF